MRTIENERQEVRQRVVDVLKTALCELSGVQITARLQTGIKSNAANTIFTKTQMDLLENLIGDVKRLDEDMDRSQPYGENDDKTPAGSRPLTVLQSGGGSIGDSSGPLKPPMQ